MIRIGDRVEFQNKVCLVVGIESNGNLLVQPYGGGMDCRFTVSASNINKIMNEGRAEINYGERLND